SLAMPITASAAVSTHPSYLEMAVEAIKALNEPKGVTKKKVVQQVIEDHGIDAKLANRFVSQALKKGIASGVFIQPVAAGLAGRFKLPAAAPKQKKSVAAASPKRQTVSKPLKAPALKTVGKAPMKSPVKAAASTPKKAKTAAKSPKKAPTPKKMKGKKGGKKAAAPAPAAEKAAQPTAPVAE
ncbi:hypothetical protein PFISCL1PPCAC_19332, partial [Pristionchus fissidentatus]